VPNRTSEPGSWNIGQNVPGQRHLGRRFELGPHCIPVLYPARSRHGLCGIACVTYSFCLIKLFIYRKLPKSSYLPGVSKSTNYECFCVKNL